MEFDVVDLPETDHVAVGDVAPDFERPLVNSEYWEDTALSALTDEGPVLLVFHTMDGDFPAIYAWRELAERGFEEEYDVRPVGLSISSPYEHSRFLDERDLPYELFSDPANGVAEDYGIVHDLDGMAGVTEPRPAVFLLDGDRTVRYAWVAGEWPEFPDYDEIADALADL